MACPRCQQENPTDAVFCQECGGRLETTCPSCGTGVLAPRAEWRSTIVPKPAPDEARADAGARSPRRWTWARLLRRAFAIEVLVCDRCGGPRRILGAVTRLWQGS